MNLKVYRHIPYKLKPNKKKIPINDFNFDRLDEFNAIYKYALENYTEVKYTQSHGISVKVEERYEERYFVIPSNERFELVIICHQGCYRFLLHNKKQKGNDVSGRKACMEIYKQASKFNVHLSDYMVENGKDIKKEIVSPHIMVLDNIFINRVLTNVNHIDLNSSYASRISEAHPELKPMYEDLYSKRKNDNDYYKHILTNSVGCWQSEYCVNPKDNITSIPYALANLSKIAINGTRKIIEEMIEKLYDTDRRPLLTNTDGIWYFGEPYHDENEGNNLCQWKNDHTNCKFLMVSKGAYQYEENGVCTTVVRGISNLDAIEPDRTKWKFGDIRKITNITTYKFVKGIGVIKDYEERI